MDRRKELGIYIHIPFCVRKCEYCDFLSFPAGEDVREAYVQALCREIRAWNAESVRAGEYRVVSIFLGGGTPSILSAEQIRRILEAVRERFEVRGQAEQQAKSRAKSQAENCTESRAKTCTDDMELVKGKDLIGTNEWLKNREEGAQERRYSAKERKKDTQEQKRDAGDEVEISLESNPGTLTEAKLRKLRELGVNRLSMGLQSAVDRELQLLGRIHDRAVFEENYYAARRAGFANINVDLMSALPGQTAASWRGTLDYVTGLNPPPEHISAYSLIIEEGTPFYDRYHEADERRERFGDGSNVGDESDMLPSEQTEREMYRLTREFLQERGYERYEVSNYAKPGFACRHNLGYWTRRDYIGLGLGAASCLANVRWSNTRNMRKYLEIFSEDDVFGEAREDIIILSETDRVEETVFLGLRMTEGIDLDGFAKTFGWRFEDRYAERIERLVREGIAEVITVRSSLRLTQQGMDLEGYAEMTTAPSFLRLTERGMDLEGYAERVLLT